jgi:hypothetical protein
MPGHSSWVCALVRCTFQVSEAEQFMKKFVGIYLGTQAARERARWDTLDAAKRKELETAGIKAWGDWHAANQAAILENGGPLGKTKRISPAGIEDVKNNMTGYVIVQAESHEAAAKLFLNHPHFTVFPGEAVEVMEWLPIPGQ